jgi:heterodisulfide reductase subunit A-like polyferredoxin
MHAAKQAVLTRSHEPDTETTIYFMDVRAHGKGFDDYIERARHAHAVRYKRSLISQVYLNPDNENLIIETFDHHRNRKIEEEYDLVVLSSGFKPAEDWKDLIGRLGLTVGPYGFLAGDIDDPVATTREGVFACGGIEEPKDIPETVIQAGAAAAEAALVIHTGRDTATTTIEEIPERVDEGEPRIGVFVCHCGSNIAGVVDIPSLMAHIEKMPHVMLATDFVFTCSAETQQPLIDLIKKYRLNRVVVAACSPKTHEPLFRETLRQAGLNPYLFEMANIRNQCSWVHGSEPGRATGKSLELIRAGVFRAQHLEPLKDQSYDVVHQALVVGGGLAGMTAALKLADQGYPVHLVEREAQLGGFARQLTETLEGNSPLKMVRNLTDRVLRHPLIDLSLRSGLTAHRGHVGAFSGTVEGPEGTRDIDYGAVIVATGGRAYEPQEYLCGTDKRVLAQVELSRRIKKDLAWVRALDRVVMIQCIGSRNDEFTFCSRVCCSAAVKNSIAIKELNPDAQVVILYRDLRTFGFKELYYLKARRMGVMFFRFIPDEPPQVYNDTDGKLTVDFNDRSSHQDFRVESDLVVLSAGIRPNCGADQIAPILKLPRTHEGFFLEAHVKLQPLEFASPGIFLAGLAHSPRFISEALSMAGGAAQQAAKILSRERMSTPATVAEVNADLCAACLACVRSCPFDAPSINADGVSEIPPAKCRGCGICIVECPARAITLKHSTDEQIEAKIDALLE